VLEQRLKSEVRAQHSLQQPSTAAEQLLHSWQDPLKPLLLALRRD
jgi:hypothetical protein